MNLTISFRESPNMTSHTRRSRSIIAAACAAPLLLAGVALAQNDTDPNAPGSSAPVVADLPTAKEIVERSIESSGGERAMRNSEGRTLKGRLELPGMNITGEVVVYAAPPNLMTTEITIPGLGITRRGYDGTHGWALDPVQGPMLMEGDELRQLKREVDFFGSLNLFKQYQTVETVGEEMFDGQKAWKVRLVDGEDETFHYYSQENGLQIGMSGVMKSPMGELQATTFMREYKDFDGMKMPTMVLVKVMGQEQIIRTLSVNDGMIEKAKFAPPMEIQALIKADEEARKNAEKDKAGNGGGSNATGTSNGR